jgi:uncharacterized protein HemX
MSNVQQQTRVLLIAGRTLQQKSRKLDELIRQIQANAESLDAALDEACAGFDDSIREAILSLNGLPSENSDDRIVDDIDTLLSDYFFHEAVDEENSIMRIEDRLSELTKDLD